jgi:hypothetical protein
MKLMDQVRGLLRAKHYSYRTEKCYVYWFSMESSIPARWARRRSKGPHTPGNGRQSSREHAESSARCLLFLYRDVLKQEVGELNAVRARRPVRVPTVMSRAEATQVLQRLAELDTREPYALMAQLMYGAGYG